MKKMFLTGFLLQLFLLAQAQMFSAAFEYDENGNRIGAEVIYLSKSGQLFGEQTEFEDKTDDFAVKVFPNPTSGYLIIEVAGIKAEKVQDMKGIIEVFDISGKMVLKITVLKDSNEINLSSKPDGVYLVRLKVGDYRKTYKVIKN